MECGVDSHTPYQTFIPTTIGKYKLSLIYHAAVDGYMNILSIRVNLISTRESKILLS